MLSLPNTDELVTEILLHFQAKEIAVRISVGCDHLPEEYLCKGCVASSYLDYDTYHFEKAGVEYKYTQIDGGQLSFTGEIRDVREHLVDCLEFIFDCTDFGDYVVADYAAADRDIAAFV